jgi:hypothetical protein
VRTLSGTDPGKMVMPANATQQSDFEAEMFPLAASCKGDPLRFVKLAYPWGEVGGPLAKHPGPDDWQTEVLAYIRDNLGLGRPLRIAVAGGVGPGKSALMAWIVDWGMTTMPDCRCRITANTGPQITTATWPEITKWRRLSLWSEWFESGDRRIRSIDPPHRDSWRCDAITWDKNRSEAFAGFHNSGRRIIYGFDEASAIEDPIFTASEGILSGADDTEIIWVCLGNPTRNNTRFRTFFAGGSNHQLWKSWHIDTRTTRMSNKTQIAEWIATYGLDSDYVRVRVLSQFPHVSSTQFISTELVNEASDLTMEASGTIYDPLIVGVDVARFGDDKSVIRFRRGPDARSIPPLKFRGIDSMQLAARIAEVNEKYKPSAIFIDQGGVGAGVVDRCRYLSLPVTGVDFGASPDRLQIGQQGAIGFATKRAEMWGSMREWLHGGIIDNDLELKADLPAVEYGYKMLNGKDVIILEKKEDMKKRGLSSPDDGDALALTFAYPVGSSDHSYQFVPSAKHEDGHDYNPYARP